MPLGRLRFRGRLKRLRRSSVSVTDWLGDEQISSFTERQQKGFDFAARSANTFSELRAAKK
ncbi:MAG: hypothetical protein C4325_14130 [Blastocatellia bacterium]